MNCFYPFRFSFKRMDLFSKLSEHIYLPNAIPDLVITEKETNIILNFKDGEVIYYPMVNMGITKEKFLNYCFALQGAKSWQDVDFRQTEKEQLQSILFENIQWQHNQIQLFGKKIYEPRFSAWYGNKAYTYSGVERRPTSWTPVLLQIKNKIEQVSGERFNAVLLNWYRDGLDSMGMHADDEKELGKYPTIASVSFGAEREFRLQRKKNKAHQIKLQLTNSSLLVMKGGLQHHWKHGIPKQKRIKEPRVNLTFRKIFNS